MKNNYSKFLLSSILCLVTFHISNAQVSHLKIGLNNPVLLSKSITPDFSQLTNDTMAPPVFLFPCFVNDPFPYVFYQLSPASGATGYLTGNNDLGGGITGIEVAQRYSFSGTGTISEVLISYAHTAGSTGLTASHIYDIDLATKTPFNILGISSNTIATGNLSTVTYSKYTFSPPVSIHVDFAVSSVFPDPSAGDTVVVTSTKITCHSNDSLSSINLGIFFGWLPYTAILDASAPPDSNIDLLILPIVDVPTGINTYPSSKGLSLLGTYPNPAHSFTNINYSVDKPSYVSISVFDLNGKVYQSYNENLGAGRHSFNLNVKELATGIYYYTVKTSNAIMTSKLSVDK